MTAASEKPEEKQPAGQEPQAVDELAGSFNG